MSLQEMVVEAADVKELGDFKQALHTLHQAVSLAKKERDYQTLLQAQTQIVVCHQLMSELQDNPALLIQMEQAAKQGLDYVRVYRIDPANERMFWYRLGICQTMRNNFGVAIRFLSQALSLLPEDENDKLYPEFAGNLGFARHMDGWPEGKRGLLLALKILERNESQYEHERFLIICSGLLMKAARMYHKESNQDEVIKTMQEVTRIGDELYLAYGLPLRSLQRFNLEKTLGIR